MTIVSEASCGDRGRGWHSYYAEKRTVINIHSKNFQLLWAIWTLALGVSLFFIHTIQNVHSFSEYLRAFATLDMPSSWCPTFLILYGTATIASYLLGDSTIKKAFTVIARFAGLVLLPVGIYATYTFTLDEPLGLNFMYIYAQTIHVSEVLTGLLTVFLLAKSKKFLSWTLLLICGGAGIFFVVKGKDTDTKRFVTGIPDCGTSNEFFTHLPVNLEDIDGIIPLGNLNPSGHTFPTDHMYLNIKEGKENIPIYAPGDVWVISLDLQERYEDGQAAKDYSVDFKPCREFRAYYIHINALSEKLQEEFDKNYSEENCMEEETGGNRFKTCFVEADVKLSAGDLIGTTGRKGQGNFDLGANDLRLDTSWVASYTKWVRWRENYLNTVCPLDYFTLDLKAKLYSIVGDFGGVRRTVEPICGTVSQDVWGTAQGVWFLSGEEVVERGREDEHMALVHDNFDPTLGAFSIGISMEEQGLPSSTYKFEPKHAGFVNRDFDEVKPDGNTYCYVASGGYSGQHHDHAIIIKMLDDKTLRIARLEGSTCGKGPWEFSSNYTDFER